MGGQLSPGSPQGRMVQSEGEGTPREGSDWWRRSEPMQDEQSICVRGWLSIGAKSEPFRSHPRRMGAVACSATAWAG